MQKEVAMERKPRKHFTFEERKKIADCLENGNSLLDLSKEFGRHYTCVCRHIRKNGGRKKYNQENKSTMSEIYEKLSAMEMQIEILHETIKELKNGKD